MFAKTFLVGLLVVTFIIINITKSEGIFPWHIQKQYYPKYLADGHDKYWMFRFMPFYSKYWHHFTNRTPRQIALVKNVKLLN